MRLIDNKDIEVSHFLEQMTRGRIFLIVFLYSLGMGGLLQLFLLPVLFPALNAGNGLLLGTDAVGFHQLSVEMANRIREAGWSAWCYMPGFQPVSFSAPIYVITGIDKPWVLLPINSLLFGLAAAALFQIFRTMATARQAAVVILPFACFPSALQLYGQIHRDVWTIFGYLLFSLVWVHFAYSDTLSWKGLMTRCSMLVLAVLIFSFFRPYLTQIASMASLVVVSLLGVSRIRRNRDWSARDARKWWVGVILCLALSLSLYPVLGKLLQLDSSLFSGGDVQTGIAEGVSGAKESGWRYSGWMPSFLEHKLMALSQSREGFRSTRGGSNVDEDVQFKSVGDVLDYIPRAMQIALFSPFPSTWLAPAMTPGGDKMRLVAAAESLLAYVAMVGVGFLLALAPAQRRVGMVVIALAIVPLVVIGLVVCNAGTLYRMRYEYWQMLLGLGMLGWGYVIKRCINGRRG